MAVHIRYWTASELAKRIGCSTTSVSRYVRSGRLAGVVRVPLEGGRSVYLIPEQDLSGLGGPRGRRKVR